MIRISFFGLLSSANEFVFFLFFFVFLAVRGSHSFSRDTLTQRSASARRIRRSSGLVLGRSREPGSLGILGRGR
jgi:hypothetical protein